MIYDPAAMRVLNYSVSEGLSQATVEAMAVGVPVVVTDVGGVREFVRDGEHARVVPSRRPDAREEMGRRAAADVHSRYDAGTQIDGLVAMYRELDPGRRSGQPR